jgi:hypothetical protein
LSHPRFLSRWKFVACEGVVITDDDLTYSLWRNQVGQFGVLTEYQGRRVQTQTFMNLERLASHAAEEDDPIRRLYQLFKEGEGK